MGAKERGERREGGEEKKEGREERKKGRKKREKGKKRRKGKKKRAFLPSRSPDLSGGGVLPSGLCQRLLSAV